MIERLVLSVIVLVSLVPGFSAFGQINPLLKEIEQVQITQNAFYQLGLFSSQLVTGEKIHDDNNIFYTALTLYTLHSIIDSLSLDERKCVDSVQVKARTVFPLYRNRNGGITYNFYQTQPEKPFPGVKWLARSKRGRLPDDLDDTSLLYLVQNLPDSLNWAVKQLMIQQSFLQTKVKSTFKRYQESIAYRTWFAHRMKQDLDVCVMANVLTFVFEKKLPLDTVDYATIDFIKRMIADRVHIKQPHIISSHYQKTAIILYHIARLMAKSPQVDWGNTREQVIADIANQLQQEIHPMEKVVLLTSLYRLGAKAEFQLSISELTKSMDDFYWFRASPLYGSRVWFKKLIGQRALTQFSYRSHAFYKSLLLELLVITRAEWINHSEISSAVVRSKR